ncbi:hypothetical protein FRC10_002222 [Ceratobasidium sp. 414]|nr:hypothetical protein FRC10_002222 [Ceratobasidium sp. 414]
MSIDKSFACESPASSSSTSNPRKRARPSDMTPDERKEARAQRNRIAAQCSRDRRKLQFSELESRVAELEEENQKLRAGIVPESPKVQQKPDHEQEKREKENEELRERVRQLEKAWENVSLLLSSIGANANGLNPLASLAVSPDTLSPSASTVTPIPSVPTDMDSTNESARHLARVACGVNSSLSVAPSLQRALSTSPSMLPPSLTSPSRPTTQLLQMKTSMSTSGSTLFSSLRRSNRKPLARLGTLRPPGRSRIRTRLCRR